MAVVLKKSRALDALNMTPFIDVVFILLIFFLVAARFAQEDHEIPVQLPTAQSALPMTLTPEVLTVGIDEHGNFKAEGQPLAAAELEERIRQRVADNPLNQMVIIRGDRRVPFQFVVAVMDMCRQHKVPTYKVTTAVPETSGQATE
jgi:biopolymer transport protein ExbD